MQIFSYKKDLQENNLRQLQEKPGQGLNCVLFLLIFRLSVLLRGTTIMSTSTPTCTWPVSTIGTGMFRKLYGPGQRQLE